MRVVPETGLRLRGWPTGPGPGWETWNRWSQCVRAKAHDPTS